jgi:hypothetical protein
MNFFDFYRSLTAHEPDECPHCHSTLHVGSGLCLRCLLQAGLTEDEDSGSESLERSLSKPNNGANQ